MRLKNSEQSARQQPLIITVHSRDNDFPKTTRLWLLGVVYVLVHHVDTGADRGVSRLQTDHGFLEDRKSGNQTALTPYWMVSLAGIMNQPLPEFDGTAFQ